MTALRPEWIVPEWPAAPGVRALVTTRAGGVSGGGYRSLNLGARGGDDPDAVARNRKILREFLPADPLWLHQVHGMEVVVAEAAGPLPQGDAAVARTRNRVCAVLTADCLPVLLTDRSGEVVGIAHAGWRGLAGGVIEAAVAAMVVTPSRILAWLGPGIGPRAYEVGSDVRDRFVSQDPAAARAFADRGDGKYLADLYALARQRLAAAGVTAVYGGRFCTYSEPERFYSYRRNGATGRFASLIWMA